MSNKKIHLTKPQKLTRLRILEISYNSQYSHLGSCLSAVDLIDAVYEIKTSQDKFVLSNGHAGVALYVILEKYNLIKDPKIIKKLFIHPSRNKKTGIEVSTGSLGQGLPIALGMALADRKKDIYCMVSDGECAEGSIWEALRIAVDLNLNNLKIIINANGWGAYDPIILPTLKKRLKSFGCAFIELNGHDPTGLKKSFRTKDKNKPILFFANTTVEQLPFLQGQDSHYYVMKKEDYLQSLDYLK